MEYDISDTPTANEKDKATGWLFDGAATDAASDFHFKTIAAYSQYRFDFSSYLNFKANIRIEQSRFDYKGTSQGFNENWEKVSLEHIILKPNMILSGYDAPNREGMEEVAKATLNCFNRCVPAAVPAVAFLSGGQEDKEALDNLAQMNTEHYLPWALSFSFGRTLQGGALQRWSSHLQRWSNSCCSQVSGSPEDWLLYRAQQCSEAVKGIFIVGEDS